VKIDYSRIPILMAAFTAIIGTFRIKSFLKNEYLILVILWANTIIDIYATNMSLKEQNNSVLYNILIPFEVILTLGIYYFYIQKVFIRNMIFINIIIFTLFSLLNLIFFQNFYSEFASFTFFIGGFLISLFSYFLMRYEVENKIISGSNLILWFAFANFLYYLVSVPVMSANNWLVEYSKDMALPVHGINLFIYGLWALVICIGILWKNNQTK
jgi:hypothetical protein